jgi:hypothetical protein
MNWQKPKEDKMAKTKKTKWQKYIGCPTSGVTQRAMREAAPHSHGVSKARQL